MTGSVKHKIIMEWIYKIISDILRDCENPIDAEKRMKDWVSKSDPQIAGPVMIAFRKMQFEWEYST